MQTAFVGEGLGGYLRVGAASLLKFPCGDDVLRDVGNERLTQLAGFVRLGVRQLLFERLDRLGLRVELLHDVIRRERRFAVLGAREDSGQRVVVLRRDRVELVIVAAGARHRQAEEPAAERVDPVVDLVRLRLSRAARVLVVDRSQREVTQRGKPLQPATCERHGASRRFRYHSIGLTGG